MKKLVYLLLSGLCCGILLTASLLLLLTLPYWHTACFFYLLLLTDFLLVYSNRLAHKRWKTGYWSTLILSCILGAAFSSPFVLRFKLFGKDSLFWLLFGWVVLFVTVLWTAFIGRRQKSQVHFSSMNSLSGKRAIRKAYLLSYTSVIVMVLFSGLCLDQYLNFDRLSALAGLFLSILIPTLFAGFSIGRMANRLLLDQMDPVAFYDLYACLHQNAKRRRQQDFYALSLVNAYIDLGQNDTAQKLANRLWDDNCLPPVQRAILAVQQATCCNNLTDFNRAEQFCRPLVAAVRSRKLATQLDLNLRGRRAQLEQDAAGMLAYADALETCLQPCRRNQVAAAVNRAMAWQLTSQTEKARAAWQFAAAEGGGSFMASKARAALKQLENPVYQKSDEQGSDFSDSFS